MNRTAIRLAAAMLASLGPLSSALAQHERYRPEVGQPHPEIVLPRIDDRQSVSLTDYRGKKLLLIHFASW